MSDALIAVVVVLVTAFVLALPGRRAAGPGQFRVERRRRVLRAVAWAIVISLWPALTWHGSWWAGPVTGLVLLAAYLYALRPWSRGSRRRAATARSDRPDEAGRSPTGRSAPGESVPLRVTSPPRP